MVCIFYFSIGHKTFFPSVAKINIRSQFHHRRSYIVSDNECLHFLVVTRKVSLENQLKEHEW